MDKEIVKLLIAEYQQKVMEVSFQERPYIIEDKLNYVFVGLRRVGKSYLMFQQIRHLLDAVIQRMKFFILTLRTTGLLHWPPKI
jgi:predicted AAA+ superfamily ATPase